jgi:steroid delta-isomerase-like uncharacterized protein
MSNSETAVAFLEAGFRKDFDAAAPLVGERLESHDRARSFHARTVDELVEMQAERIDAWSDQLLRIEHVMETLEGTVIVQATVDATHTGTFFSVPATGRRVHFEICYLFRFDSDGRIVSEDDYKDLLSPMIALGAVQRLDGE